MARLVLDRHSFHSHSAVCCLLLWSVCVAIPCLGRADEVALAAGDAAAAPLVAEQLSFETGRPAGAPVVLAGQDAREQLVLTRTDALGAATDVTASARYQADPAGIVAVDASGLVTPLADGAATITATLPPAAEGQPAGPTATLPIEVRHVAEQLPINFPERIVPIFTKLGCNGGGCHGKASGQNGFKLSLLGFEPPEDYEYLVKEARGRRLFPAAPDRSLLLVKATNQTPHGGGMRLAVDSHEYRLLRRWIAQGMPYGKEDDAKVARIDVVPGRRIMARQGRQQIKVIATYTDNSTEDVTRLAQFDANDGEMAEVSATGLVSTRDLTGDVAVMARYQGQVGVFRASVPLGASVEQLPPVRNRIDELVFGKLRELGVPPSAVCDDATFLRRVTVDVAGRLPTLAETTAFLADENPERRSVWIESLLASPDYAEYFGNKWAAVLRNKRRDANSIHGTFAFASWIRQSLYANKPYDQFVREVLAAAGEAGENPPVTWYREVQDASQQAEDTAQLFLGLRIQCAKCHHHPFEKWSQRDYYGFSAFFARVGRRPAELPGEQEVFHKPGKAEAKHPKTGEQVPAAGLGAAPIEIAPDRDPRQALVDWMADPANPHFAPALVNRYWKHFFDRGIVDPEDDMRLTNPASNPDLLDALAKDFVAHGFDLKHLVRTIVTSSAYQLSSLPNDYNLTDKQNFSRYYPKRLTAEVLLDALNQVTESSTEFTGLPLGTRAVQLPDQGSNTYFLTVFGKPQADTACECERSQEANLAQSLHLLNSAEVHGKLSADAGRAAKLAVDESRPHEARVAEIYLWAYSRLPLADEQQIAVAHIAKHENKRQAYEDILWALINTKEFLFNH